MAGLPFLTSSYFTGELFIPNISGTTAAAIANAAELTSFIAEYEPEYLTKLLGTDLYDEFKAGIAVAVPAAKWTALKAKIYDTTLYKSPAAKYVYFFYQQKQKSYTTPTGEATALHENAQPAGLSFKQMRAWNKMVKENQLIWEWLDENSDTYDTFSTDYVDEINFYVNQWGI